MSNDKNNIMNDDEYQFPRDEYLHQATATADPGDTVDDVNEEKIVKKQSAFKQASQRFPVLKNKKLYFALAFGVVIIVGIRMMHNGGEHHEKVISQKSVAAMHTVQPAAQVEKPNTQLLNKLDSLKSNQASNQDTLSSLQNNISGLKSKLNQADSNNAQLAQSVETLTAQIKILAAQVDKNTKTLTAKPKKVHHKPVHHVKPITYDIKAIVPGRAWIVSSKGNSYSVAVGNKITQYGRVKAINSDMGRIYTTSGKVIGYGPNDS